MVTRITWTSLCWIILGIVIPAGAQAGAGQQAGSIRGVVLDKDFGVPLSGARVAIVELDRSVKTMEQGNYVIGQVAPGKYTLVIAKEGYVRQVKGDVVVTTGNLSEVDASLAGDFTDMEEFVVQDVLRLDPGSDADLLQVRFESPSLMNSISADLMRRAGASDAASALRLVSGASLQNGKSAVIRGLPDRYVSSQMNGVRLPSADEDRRAVELDQFPAAVVESIQVSKTFTPDQQGDASGGAVDVRLKSVPDHTIVKFKSEISANSQVTGRRDFLTYKDGGVDAWGRAGDSRDIQEIFSPFSDTGGIHSQIENWDGAVGTSPGRAPTDYKFSTSLGGKIDLTSDVRIGGFANFFYERDSSFYNDGIDDSFWIDNPGGPLTPFTKQGTPSQGEFKTSLFDVQQSDESVQWGGLGTFGIETDANSLGVTYLYSRTAEDKATLALDTRGKEYFFPGYDPNNPRGTGNTPDELFAAPYLRLETLEYTKRTSETLQFNGRHKLPLDPPHLGGALTFRRPELDWVVARSSATMDQPDKRQFGALWVPPSHNPGVPPWVPPFTTPPRWFPFKPAENFNLGNVQRTWKKIDENSTQYSFNLKWPFDQWTGDRGYLKSGIFADRVNRTFNQDSFSNFGDSSASYEGDWSDPWSAVFPGEDHPITDSKLDVAYDGKIDLSAWYAMLDLPFSSSLSVIGGARFEKTQIGAVIDPEEKATWFPPGATAPVKLNPGDADVEFAQADTLPSLGFVLEPLEGVNLRGSYSETVARQTFKELTPIIQQEFIGGPIFIGNPELEMSALKNYDLRFDYTPYDGGLFSASYFRKKIKNPIEYVQRVLDFTFTTPVNYPKGKISGWEFEARQGLGHIWEPLNGLSLGANATFVNSRVTLPADETAAFADPSIDVQLTRRKMTNAPDHIYNLYLTYDLEATGTQIALFYTVQGDALIAGAAESKGNFVPSIYAKEYDTLNLSLFQNIGQYVKLQVEAKNLTNPRIEEVYRSDVIDSDVTTTSFTKGIEYSISLNVSVTF